MVIKIEKKNYRLLKIDLEIIVLYKWVKKIMKRNNVERNSCSFIVEMIFCLYV